MRLRHQRSLLFEALQARRRLSRIGHLAEFRQGFTQAGGMLAERLLVRHLVRTIGQHRGQHGAPLETAKFSRVGAHLAGQILLARRDVGRAFEIAAEIASDQQPAGAQ